MSENLKNALVIRDSLLRSARALKHWSDSAYGRLACARLDLFHLREDQERAKELYDECVNLLKKEFIAWPWISIHESKPPDDEYVLAYDERFEEVRGYWYCAERDLFVNEDDDDFYPFVSHWMPVPPPPEDVVIEDDEL